MGLGLSNSARIGGYAILPTEIIADGSEVFFIGRRDNSGKWGADYGFYSIGIKPQLSWSEAGGGGRSAEPDAYKNLTIKFGVQAYINKASELDLTKPVILDGLTTLELIYL
ncbi:Uncharacterised protein [Serratia liquefaciens]|nr:Uncharacterised protein [Serratia liquefaciens]